MAGDADLDDIAADSNDDVVGASRVPEKGSRFSGDREGVDRLQ